MMKIIIDPRIKYNYATWYLWGLTKQFGQKALSFDVTPFTGLKCEKLLQYNRGIPFIYMDGKEDLKVFIDYFDDATIDEDRYEWCDLYAKVNVTCEQLDNHKKVFPIGPSFGIRDHGLFRLLILGFSHAYKGRGNTSMPYKRILADHIYPYVRRISLDDYSVFNRNTDDNYVFQLSTLWNGKKEKECINDVRKNFLVACKECNVDLEGGFFYTGAKNEWYKGYLEDYKDYLYFKRIGIKEYLQRIAKSFVVFNCPAVAGCLGWKLAEFLLMGKAIISMPINHPMPGNGLIHGVNVHFVHTIDEMKDAICLIREDKEYREWLQVNARSYFDEYLEPQRVIQRVFGVFGIDVDHII